jgi:hypothetical protein
MRHVIRNLGKWVTAQIVNKLTLSQDPPVKSNKEWYFDETTGNLFHETQCKGCFPHAKHISTAIRNNDPSFKEAQEEMITFWLEKSGCKDINQKLAKERSNLETLRMDFHDLDQKLKASNKAHQAAQRRNEEMTHKLSQLNIEVSIKAERISTLEEELSSIQKEEPIGTHESIARNTTESTTYTSHNNGSQPPSKKRKLNDQEKHLSTRAKQDHVGTLLTGKKKHVSMNHFMCQPNLR